MIAVGDIVKSLMTKPAPPVLILVGVDDIQRIFDQIPKWTLTPSTVPPDPQFMGMPIVEDPGIPPGTFEFTTDPLAAKRRRELIRLGLTVTPEGLIKPADWWRK